MLETSRYRVALCLSLFAIIGIKADTPQPHPRLLFGEEDRKWLSAQVEANSTRWQALRAECDSYLDLPVSYPDQYGDGSPRQPRVPASGSDYTRIPITAGYAGEDYLSRVWSLGACYLATRNAPSFPKDLSDRYGEKLRQIAIAASVAPGTVKKPIVQSTLIRVDQGKAKLNGPEVRTLPAGMEVFIQEASEGLNGFHDITIETPGTISFLAPNVPDGDYKGSLSAILRIHPVNKRVSVYAVTAGNPTRIGVAAHGMKTGDQVLLEGLEGPWDALNGEHTVTVVDASTFSIPINTTGAGAFRFQYAFGTAFRKNQPASFYFAGNVNTLFRAGDVVDVSQLTGCTELNGSWTLGIPAAGSMTFSRDEQPAIAASPCSNYSYSSLRDSGYSFRNYAVLLALIYDWANDKLTPEEQTAIIDRVNLYLRENRRIEQDSTTLHPSHNYFAGFLNGAVLANIAFGSENKEPLLDWFVNDPVNGRLYGDGFFLSYFNRWLSHGGYPQGNREYGNHAVASLYLSAIASQVAGKPWVDPTVSWGWFGAELSYLMAFASPALTELDFNNFTAGINGNDSGANAPPLDEPNRINPNMTAVVAYWARKAGHPLRDAFTRFHFETKDLVQQSANSGLKPGFRSQTNLTTIPRKAFEFLFEDPDAAQEEWKVKERMTGYGLSGNYAATRLGWGPNDVQVTFDANRELDNVSQGKSRWNAGTVTVRRGRKALIDYPNAWVSRYGTATQHSVFHNTASAVAGSATWRWDNVFFADASTSAGIGSQDYRSQCVSPANSVPSANGLATRKNNPSRNSRLDLITESEAVTYWRGVDLQCNYGRPSPANNRVNVEEWTREVLVLRDSGVVVVRDATKVANRSDNRFLSWVLPAEPQLIEPQQEGGARRYRVQNPAGDFLGMVSVVRPSNAKVESHKWSNAEFLYSLEIKPNEEEDRALYFVTVLDPAESDGSAKETAELKGNGGLFIRIGADTVTGFVDGNSQFDYPGPADIRRHVFAGLDANRNYFLTKTQNGWRVSAGEGEIPFTADASGIGVVVIN